MTELYMGNFMELQIHENNKDSLVNYFPHRQICENLKVKLW